MASVETSARYSLPGPAEAGSSHETAVARTRDVRRSVLMSATVVLVYLLIALVAFWPVLPTSSGRLFGRSTPDPGLTVWFLGWAAHALVHGQNLFFSHAIFVPKGVNLTQNTSVPLLGILVAPITLLFGPVASANLLMVLAMPLSATAAFVVLRKWHVWGSASALGGLMYGFSPYMVGQSLGHLSLVFVPLPPFIAFFIVRILQGKGSSLWLGIGLGFLIAAQFLISPEILATVAILVVFALLCAAVRYRENLLRRSRDAALPTCVAIAVAAVLLAYPLWIMLAGPQLISGPLQGAVNPYYNDLLSFVVPGPFSAFRSVCDPSAYVSLASVIPRSPAAISACLSFL